MLPKITRDSTIAVIAPGFPPDPQKTKKGIIYLENKGYSVKRAKSLNGNYAYFSATDEQRADEINSYFADPDIDAIFCARGGWGSLRLLDKLDYNVIKQNPKLLLGYSDITTLQLALWKKCRMPSISGPMVATDMSDDITHFTEEHLWGQIENQSNSYIVDLSDLENTVVIKKGTCSGTLLGGCLSLVVHQLCTPYSPDYNGAILFLEDIGERPYRIDRCLAQLKQAGILAKISGLIAGEFIDCEDNNNSFSVKELFEQYTSDAHYPVIFNFPYGHNPKKISMPVGVRAQLNTIRNIFEFKNPFI